MYIRNFLHRQTKKFKLLIRSSPEQSAVLSTARNALLEIDPTIIARLTPLDLSDVLNLPQKEAISSGAFGDIFKGLCTVTGQGDIEVAIKRMRFHLSSQDFKAVRIFALKAAPRCSPYLGFRARDLRLGEAQTSQRSTSSWIPSLVRRLRNTG